MPYSPSTRRYDPGRVYENVPLRIHRSKRSIEKRSPRDSSHDAFGKNTPRYTDQRILMCHVPHHSRRPRRSLNLNRVGHFTDNFAETQKTNLEPEQDEQLQILAGFSAGTLRELITDCVLELLKSHPNSLKTSAHSSLTRHERTNSRGQRKTILPCTHRKARSDPSTYWDGHNVRNLPQSECKSSTSHLNSNQTMTQRRLLYEEPRKSALKSTQVVSNPRDYQPSDREQSQSNRSPKFLNSQLFNATCESTNHGKQPTSPYLLLKSNLRARSSKPSDVHPGPSLPSSDPFTHQSPITSPVYSSPHTPRAYSANGTLKKLRFERQKPVRVQADLENEK